MNHRDALAQARSLVTRRQADKARVSMPMLVRRTDQEKRLAYAEVYVPMRLDAHGEFMTVDDVEAIAHAFARKIAEGGNGRIDVMHDELPGRAHVAETFIARKGDPDFIEGAWVIALKVADDALWQDIKSGKKAGLSFQAWVNKIPVECDVAEDGVTISKYAEAA